MSGFSDIARAYSDHKRAGSWQDVNYGLIYTCNGGWIDLGHLNPTSPRPKIGASNLWEQIKWGGPDVVRAECQRADLNIGYAQMRMLLSGCHKDDLFRFENGASAFKVKFRMDHGSPFEAKTKKNAAMRVVAGGVEKHYAVRHNLPEPRRKAVALAIFMDVSNAFEWRQRIMGLGGLATDSGHSQEDLVSNLVGFHVAIGSISKGDAIDLLHPVPQDLAEDLWRTNGAVGSNKNRTYVPDILDTARDDDIRMVCEDYCAFQPRTFPDVFTSVTPAEQGLEFREIAQTVY